MREVAWIIDSQETRNMRAEHGMILPEIHESMNDKDE